MSWPSRHRELRRQVFRRRRDRRPAAAGARPRLVPRACPPPVAGAGGGMGAAPALSLAAGGRRRRRDSFIFSPRPSRSSGSSACSPCFAPGLPMPSRAGGPSAPCSSALAALGAGEFCGGWRAARIEAPVLDRIFVGELAGFVEEVDYRIQGSRFLLRLTEAQNLVAGQDALPGAPDLARQSGLCRRRFRRGQGAAAAARPRLAAGRL